MKLYKITVPSDETGIWDAPPDYDILIVLAENEAQAHELAVVKSRYNEIVQIYSKVEEIITDEPQVLFFGWNGKEYCL